MQWHWGIGPSAKHVLGVLEWSYVVPEKPFGQIKVFNQELGLRRWFLIRNFWYFLVFFLYFRFQKVEPLNYYFSIIHRNKGTFRNQWQSLYNSLLIAIVIAYCKNRTWVFFFLFLFFPLTLALFQKLFQARNWTLGLKAWASTCGVF